MRVSSRSIMKTLHTVAHIAIVGFAFGYLAPATDISAQENDECLMCHEDAELVGELRGVEISMFVDPTAYSASVHNEFACIDCHSDLDGVELPHNEDLDVVSCAMCHDDMAEALAAGPHGKWAGDPSSPSAACIGCHGVHDVRSSKKPGSPTAPGHVDDLCGKCHPSQLKAVTKSPHGAIMGGRPASTCADCHRGHGVIAPSEPLAQVRVCG
ncbi:MAG: hypothetical protein E4H44_02605, partial [Candidatus Aminicenantes bacterium]